MRINAKERFYLQWLENGKLKSKYIKAAEFDEISAQMEKKKQLQDELKVLKETTEGLREQNLKRKAARNMQNITGTLMSEDRVIATVKNGEMIDYDEALIPLYLKRTKYMEGWLASRAIDTHRTNSRLLKRALRLHTADNAQTALAVNAATVTDRYWFKPEGSHACYEEIRFKENYFDNLALFGDPNGFSHKPSRTPELTNTGSFEKCWRLIDGTWWIYKSGTKNEYFSELFICKLGEKLGLDMAHYDICISRSNAIKYNKRGVAKREYSGRVMLYVPKEKWVGKLQEYHTFKIETDENGKEKWKAIHRGKLINHPDIEIITKFNAEIRGLYNYYRLANNVSVLSKFAYIMEYSMYKTYACKYRSTVSRMIDKYSRNGVFAVPYETKAGTKYCEFYHDGFKRIKETLSTPDILPEYSRKYESPNSNAARIKRGVCELCGQKTDDIRMHHVRTLKELTDDSEWERLMRKMRRKTLAVCKACHDEIHNVTA